MPTSVSLWASNELHVSKERRSIRKGASLFCARVRLAERNGEVAGDGMWRRSGVAAGADACLGLDARPGTDACSGAAACVGVCWGRRAAAVVCRRECAAGCSVVRSRAVVPGAVCRRECAAECSIRRRIAVGRVRPRLELRFAFRCGLPHEHGGRAAKVERCRAA